MRQWERRTDVPVHLVCHCLRKEAIEAMMRRFDFTKAFGVVVSGEDVEQGKLAADIFLDCMDISYLDKHLLMRFAARE